MEQLLIALLIGSGLYLSWDAVMGQPSETEKEQQRVQAARKREQAAAVAWAAELDARRRATKRNTLSGRLSAKLGLERKQLIQALTLSFPTAVAGGMAAWFIWGWPVLAAAGIGAGAVSPLIFLSNQQAKRRGQFEEDLAEAVEFLRSVLQASQGLAGAVLSLAEYGPERLRPEFTRIYQDASIYGLEPALRLAQDRLENAQFDFVAIVLIQADSKGSSIGDVLKALAETSRDRIASTREIKAEQIRQVWSARVVALMPIGLLTLLKLMGSGYTDTLDSLAGQFILCVGLTLAAAGYVMMRWIGHIPTEKRTFK